MPELPEVETVKETLKNLIIGKKIIDVIVHYDKIIKGIKPELFKEKLKNQEITDIRRYGKYLLFDLNDYTLVSHLRMEGKYFVKDNIADLSKHEHIIFALDNSEYLIYHDVRKFGTMELTEYQCENTLKSINVLGKEINDPKLNADYLYSYTNQANRPIKSILLDQHIVTGLGNIYVDETLFLANIHPKRLGKNLSITHIDKIVKSAKKVIKKAIELGGTTIRTYQSSFGVDGRFQNELNVHTFAGKPCKVCKETIIKTRVGGRGTYFCPSCQKEDKTYIVGLTGGIASGKSLVTNWFKDKNVKVLDADEIYKNLLKTNKLMYNEIAREFGNEIAKDSEIDRVSLGKIVFGNKRKRLRLNEITHPFVLARMKELIKLARVKEDIIVLDIPLLYEVKLEYLCDIVILVCVNKDVQIRRLMKRDNLTEQEAITKIGAQMNMECKKNKSDIIINNNFDIGTSKKQFLEIYKMLRSVEHVN
ncbi:DNA-formamidopyrimidine glycosylase [Mycoplasmatota bacterium WC30]